MRGARRGNLFLCLSCGIRAGRGNRVPMTKNQNTNHTQDTGSIHTHTVGMTSAGTPPLHVFRGILRLLKQSTPSKSPYASSPAAAAALPETQPKNAQLTLRQHITSQYRQSQSLSPDKAIIQRQIAYDFFVLKRDLKERARLHSLDQGADEKLSPRELSRRAAARAGLQLPLSDSAEEARRREE